MGSVHSIRSGRAQVGAAERRVEMVVEDNSPTHLPWAFDHDLHWSVHVIGTVGKVLFYDLPTVYIGVPEL